MLFLLVKMPCSSERTDQFDCILITVWKCNIWQQCYLSFTSYNGILYMHKIQDVCTLQIKAGEVNVCHLMALGITLASVKIVFLLFSTNIPRRKCGNLLPVNIRIKLPRLHTSEVYSPLFYIICFHQGVKTDKKPTTHTPSPGQKKEKLFFCQKYIH